MGDKSDSRSRKWMITINNPLDKGFTHDKIKEVLTSIRSLDYLAMCDEIGNEKHTLHTHIIIHRGGALRFSTLQKMFPPGSQLDNLRGTMQQARDYIRKEGKYKGSSKEETNLKNTFEESGMVPDERQGQRSDLIALYDMIKDGKSNYEILEDNPNYMLQLEKVERCREILRYEEFKNKVRDIQVEYWYGDPGTGKTSGVYALYGGYDKVYRITDSRNPWDGYKGQDVILFDDFRACDFDINVLLKWLDIYPLELPCRYNNKQACFTRIYFTSNIPFDQLYKTVQSDDTGTWNAFCRRFNTIKQFCNDEVFSYHGYDDFIKNRWLPFDDSVDWFRNNYGVKV